MTKLWSLADAAAVLRIKARSDEVAAQMVQAGRALEFCLSELNALERLAKDNGFGLPANAMTALNSMRPALALVPK